MLINVQSGGLPNLVDFVKSRQDGPAFEHLAKLALCSGILVNEKNEDGAKGLQTFRTFSWHPRYIRKNTHITTDYNGYDTEGHVVTFDPATRRLLVFNNDRDYYDRSYFEKDGKLVRTYRPKLDMHSLRHAHDEKHREIQRASGLPFEEEIDKNNRRIWGFRDYHWTGAPLEEHSNFRAMHDHPYISRDDMRAFYEAFTKDVLVHYQNFLKSIDPQATAFFKEEPPMQELFSWLTQHQDDVIQPRRLKAAADGGQLTQTLFKSVRPDNAIWAPDWANVRALNVEMSDRIDQGADFIHVIAERIGSTPDFVRSKRNAIGLMVNWVNDDILDIVKMMELLPWMRLPPDGDVYTIERNACLSVLFSTRHAVKDFPSPNNRVQIRARLLSMLFASQANRLVADPNAPLSWATALENKNLMNDMNDISSRVKTHTGQVVRDIFAPAYLFRCWRQIGKLAQQDFENATKAGLYYAGKACDVYGMAEFVDTNTFRQVDTYIKGFRAHALAADPSLKNDPFFKAFGYVITDIETRDSIFHLYRDIVFRDAWPADLTLRQYLVNADFNNPAYSSRLAKDKMAFTIGG